MVIDTSYFADTRFLFWSSWWRVCALQSAFLRQSTKTAPSPITASWKWPSAKRRANGGQVYFGCRIGRFFLYFVCCMSVLSLGDHYGIINRISWFWFRCIFIRVWQYLKFFSELSSPNKHMHSNLFTVGNQNATCFWIHNER